ncbi:MAG: acetyltransferase [Anaerolineae bacterium]|jgi:sugar O-acyltransferase (sialic acid O-acetyltransferase NeuD family)
MRIIIIGAGGHGQVVADALLARQRSTAPDLVLAGYADDDRRIRGSMLGSLPVLGSIADALQIEHDAVVVAIGANRVRAEIMADLARQGESFYTVVHPSAVVAPDVTVGSGSVILAGVVVNTGSTLGAGVIVNTCASLDHHNTVGDYVHIAPGSHTGGNVTIKEGAFIGLGASVIPQRTIGEWAIVGAGATVIRDVPQGTTVVGVPAQPIKHMKEVS